MSVQISQLPNITSTQLTSGTTTSLSMPLIASVASGNVTTYQTSFSNLKTYIGNGNLSVTGNITANGGLQNTPIGNVAGQASTGSFTTITANGNITAAALSSNASITAITTLSALGGIQNTPIGNVAGQASSGSFTTVTANGNVTASALTVNNSATIGGTLGVTGNVLVTSAAGLGYGTGAGGTITQGTGRATGVTINKPTGNIILFSAAGNTTPTTFTVTNSFVANSDVIVLNQRTGTNIYLLWVSNITNGTFNITAYTTGGVTTEAPVINFAVIKGVTA